MFAKGADAVLFGLKAKPELNGRAVRVVALPDEDGGRYVVALDTGSPNASSSESMRTGPEAKFAESFLTLSELEAAGLEVKHPVFGDVCRTAADEAQRLTGRGGSLQGLGAIRAQPHNMCPQWPDGDDEYLRCRPERRGRTFIVPASCAVNTVGVRGAHRLATLFDYRWAFRSETDAEGYYEREALPRRLEDIKFDGSRAMLPGIVVAGADASAVQCGRLTDVDIRRKFGSQPAGEMVPPSDVRFIALVRVGRMCAKLFIAVHTHASVQGEGDMLRIGLDIAATAAAKMRAAQEADTPVVAAQLQLRVLPANLRAPGSRPSLPPAELGRDIAIGRLPGVERCAGCGKSEGLLRCQACMVVAYCGATCQRADWPTHKRVCAPRGRRAHAPPRPAGEVIPALPSEPADFRDKFDRVVNAQGGSEAEKLAAHERLYEEAQRRELELWTALVGSQLAVLLCRAQPERSMQIHLAAARTYHKFGDKYREGNSYADASIAMKVLPGHQAQAEQYQARGLDMMLMCMTGAGMSREDTFVMSPEYAARILAQE